MSLQVLAAHFFLTQNNIPLPVYITVYLSVQLLKDLTVAFKFWILSIQILQLHVQVYCCHKFSTNLNKYQRAS